MSIIISEERKLIGLSCECSNNQVNNFKLISDLWKRFNKELYKISNRKTEPEWTKYGIAYDSNKKDYFKYLAAIEVNEFTDDPNFTQLLLPKNKYRVFEHKGTVKNLYKSIVKVFRTDLPKLDHELIINSESNISFVEKYDKRFSWTSENSIIEIHIPIVLK